MKKDDGVLRTGADSRFWPMCSPLLFLKMDYAFCFNYVFEAIDRRLIDSFGWQTIPFRNNYLTKRKFSKIKSTAG